VVLKSEEVVICIGCVSIDTLPKIPLKGINERKENIAGCLTIVSFDEMEKSRR
jgi:hypothetical protein